jgi:hypothetical protein
VPEGTPAHLRQIETPYDGHERKRKRNNNSEIRKELRERMERN